MCDMTTNPGPLPPPCDSRRVRAFTLVEVLVVVIIIGIAAAVVVPAMLRPGSLHVQAAARIVIADLLYAQNDAIAKQRPRRVVFDLANNRYRLTDGGGTTLSVNWKGSTTGNYVVNFTSDSRFQGVNLADADFNGEPWIEFNELGAPNTGGSVDLLTFGLKYRVHVTDMTGKVSVSRVN